MAAFNVARVSKIRMLRVWRWLLVYLCIVGFYPLAFAQQISIHPVCGAPGTAVTITGTGWAEPAPVCHYNFLFDGAQFAPTQPDGLFGPPNRVGIVPKNASVGDHKIRVELRLDSNNSLLECVEDTFRVVAVNKDPFDGGKNVILGGAPEFGPGNNSIKIDFDPTDSCAVSKCTAIRAIQAIQQTAKLTSGKIRSLTFTEQGFKPANVYNDASICSTTTGCSAKAEGWTIDSISGQPYYTPPGSGNIGEQSNMPKISQLKDGPTRPFFPADPDIDEIILNFETNYFCDAGEDRGQFFGQVTWTWQKTRASLASDEFGESTKHSNGEVQPSPIFFEALNLYNKVNQYTFPTIAPKQLPPGQGGQICN